MLFNVLEWKTKPSEKNDTADVENNRPSPQRLQPLNLNINLNLNTVTSWQQHLYSQSFLDDNNLFPWWKNILSPILSPPYPELLNDKKWETGKISYQW